MPFASMGSFHAMSRMPAVMPQMNIAPVGVTILSSTATSITISFTPPHGVVTGYIPYVNGVAGTGSGTPASYTITGLTAGQTYSIMMQATMSIGGGVTNFLPTSIPGCLLWLDAADASTITYASGSSVSQWNDKSGNGYNFTAASGTYPTYSSNAMSFVGSASSAAGATQYFSNSSIPFPNTYSIFVVAKGNASQPSTSGYNYIMKATTSVDSFLFFGSKLGNFATFVGPTSSSWNDVLINSPTTSVTTNTILLGMINDGATYLTPYANGTALNTKNGNAPPFTGLTIGDPPGIYHGQCWNGTVNEILVFRSVLTNPQRQQIEGYLASKWSLQSSLPTTHPYYSTSGLTVSSVSFSPLSVPGCSVWLDAADATTITLNGSGVSQWRDKSTNGFLFTQSTAGNQPTYSTNSLNGQATLQFTAANSTYLGGGTNYAVGTNSFAIFAVFKFSDTTTNGSVFNKALYGGQQGRIIFVRENSGTFNFRIADPVNENNSFADTYAGNTYRIMCMTYNRTAGAGFIFNNGTLVSSYTADKTTNLTNTDNMIIGGYNNGSGTASPPTAGFYLNGNIAEIICYTNSYDMTLGTQQQIEGYLASKWGIRSYLNTSHPFYSVPALTNAYSQFNPKSISGMLCWLDGADPNGTGVIPVAGSSIATWVDKSGYGYNFTQSTAGSQPTYSAMSNGMYALNLATSKSINNSTIQFPTNYTIFAVGYTTLNNSGNGYIRLFSGNPDAYLFFGAGGSNNTNFATFTGNGTAWNDINTNTPTTSIASLCLMGITTNNTSTGLIPYVNGTALTAKNGTNASFTGLFIGRHVDSTQFWNGYVAEVLIYNSVLTLSQRQQVEGYLAWKWGIQTNLPVAHPYYSTSALNSAVSITNTITYNSAGSVVNSLSTAAIPGLKQKLTTAAQTAMVGAYNTYLVSSTYSGPIMNIRRSTDNATSDFYGNVNGTLGQSAGGTGVSLTTWLGAATAYVTTWYDQSGTGNHATQATTTLQPTYNTTNNYIDFNAVTNSCFALPNGAIPYNDSPYTISLKHGTQVNTAGGFIGGGAWGTSKSCLGFRFGGANYTDYWWGADLYTGTMAANNTVTSKYTQATARYIYVNGTLAGSLASSSRTQTSTGNFIGVTNNNGNEYLKSQLYFLTMFNIDLSDADRLLVEAGH